MPPASRLIHNWRLKLSALGLSLFLWAVVQAEPSNRETFSSVPVRVEVADTNWTISGSPDPPSVEIRLGGVAREIIRLAREGTTLRVPVASVGSRDTVISLRREWVEAAQRPGVTVESVFPATVALSFEPAVTRLVPVAPRLRGTLPEGLALGGRVVTNPQFVRVRGPESRVAGLDSLSLMPLDLSSVDEGGTYTVAVDTMGLAGASVIPATVALAVRAEEVVDRVLFDVPVHIGVPAGAPAGTDDPEAVPGPQRADSAVLLVDPPEVELRLRGARSLVAAVDPERLRVLVDPLMLENLIVGETRQVPVRVEGAPVGVRAVPVPEFVTVRHAEALLGVPGPISNDTPGRS